MKQPVRRARHHDSTDETRELLTADEVNDLPGYDDRNAGWDEADS
jgi:hypothetical protein